MSESSVRKSVYRLKSAPVSRSPSVPRQDEPNSHPSSDKESAGVRPSHSRPGTLERKHRSKTGSPSLRFRSQSQSRVDAVKQDSLCSRSDMPYYHSNFEGHSALPRTRGFVTHDSRYPALSFGQDQADCIPVTYRDSILRTRGELRNNANKRLTIPQSSCEGMCYNRCLFDSNDVCDYKDTIDDKTNLKILERDLLTLIAKIGQRHGETANVSVDEPPPYEAAVTPKVYRSAAPLVSTPRSLSNSRRSSRDLTGIDDRKIHKKLVRK